jgi:hypothetical protein
MVRVVCLLVVFTGLLSFTSVALADQPDTKQWELRLGLGHASTFGSVSCSPSQCTGSPQVNGLAGQLQWNFAPNLFLQGTVIYEIAAGNVPGGVFGFAIIGYQFQFP